MKDKKLIKNIMITLLQQVIAIICGFIIPKEIIQTYGSNTNGLINSITQFLTYIVIVEAGVGAVVKSLLYKPIAEKNKSDIEKILKSAQKFFRTIALIFCVYIIILCIIYPKIVSNDFSVIFTRILIVIIAISSFVEYFTGMIYTLYLQSNQQKYVVSIIQTVSLICNTIVTLLLIKSGCSIIIIQMVSSCIFVIRPIIQKIYVEKKYKLKVSKCVETYIIKQKKDAFAHQLANVIHNSVDVFLITLVMGTLQVSVYMVYRLVLQGIKQFVKTIMSGVDDFFGNIFAKEKYDEMNKMFKIYEFIYFTIITILYNLCLVLIVPFVSIYTKGIADTNYHQPIFAIILTLSEFIWAIRYLANQLINAVGHFKQTKKMALIEAGVNLIISIILIYKLGLLGVAIGTLIAMLIRGIYMIYYFSKTVLKRSVKIELKFFAIIVVETIIITAIGINVTIKMSLSNYFDWAVFAGIYGIIIAVFVFGFNIILNKELFQETLKLAKSVFKKS